MKAPLVENSKLKTFTAEDYEEPGPLRSWAPKDVFKYMWKRVGFFENPAAEAAYVEFAFPNSMKVPCIGDFFFAIVPTAFWNFGSGYFFAVNPDGSFIFPNMVFAYFIFTIVCLVKCVLELIWWRTGSLAAGKYSERAAVITVVMATIMFFFTIIEAQVALCASIGAQMRNTMADPLSCVFFTPNNAFAWNIWIVMFIFRIRLCYSLPLIMFPAIMQPFAYMWNGIAAPDAINMLICILHGLCCVALLAIEEAQGRNRFRKRLATEAAILEADEAKRHVNALMLNLIPDELLQRLMSRERVADVQEASIIYSDVAGFTMWSSPRTAKEVIRMLSDMFIRMDAHLVTHNMFKITTIGDAYWVCSGLPIPDPEHALNACLFGLKMLEVAAFVQKQHKINGIRVGVASGRAYGGIMDPKDVNYQLFGEVNEHAEHLEQLAPVARVLVSEETYRHPSVQGAKQLTFTAMADPDAHMDGAPPIGWVIDMPDGERSHRMLNTARSSAHTERSVMLLNVVAAAQQQRLELLEMKANQTQLDLDQVKVEASAENGCCACVSFATPEVEDEWGAFRREIFMTVASNVHYVNGARNGVTALLILGATALPNGVEWGIACFIVSLVLAALLFVAGRFAEKIPPGVHLLILALDININYAMIALGPMNFAVSADNQYHMAWSMQAFFVLNLWAGPVFLPVLYNLLIIVLPMLVWWAIITPEALASPIGFIINIVVLSAMSAIVAAIVFVSRRPVAVDRHVLALTQKRIADEYDTLSALLSRTLPAFVIPRLRIWLASGRKDCIAHQFALVGVCFMKRYSAGEVHWDAASTKDELAAQLDSVAQYHIAVMKNVDAECARGFDIVRIKVLGDITMIAAGLMSGSSLSLDDATTATNRSSKYSHRSKQEQASGRAPHVVGGTAQPGVFESLAPLMRIAWAMCVDQADGSRTIAGIHIGPAAAGVIGDERLIYDVFGDTVNTSARTMQTTCAQGHKDSKMFITHEVVSHLRAHGTAVEKAPLSSTKFPGKVENVHVASATVQGDETTVSFAETPEGRPMKGKGIMNVHEVVGVFQGVC